MILGHADEPKVVNGKAIPRPSDRFWSKVHKGEPDECWRWLGATNPRTGHGVFWLGNNNKKAHRVALSLSGVDVPEDIMVCHTCDNAWCCNPRHLFKGTHQDNQADKVAKGREARGATHGRSKMTAEQVLEARKRHGEGETTASLAREFGVSGASMSAIINRKHWSHI